MTVSSFNIKLSCSCLMRPPPARIRRYPCRHRSTADTVGAEVDQKGPHHNQRPIQHLGAWHQVRWLCHLWAHVRAQGRGRGIAAVE